MNSVMERFDLLRMTTALRDQMLASLTDGDLAYRLPGANSTLGELCRTMGQVEQSYIDALKTGKQNFNYAPAEQGIESSLERLGKWFKALDAELEAAFAGLTEDEVQHKTIDRGGFAPTAGMAFHIYREALLIFYGKSDTYLKALNKPLTTQWQGWVG